LTDFDCCFTVYLVAYKSGQSGNPKGRPKKADSTSRGDGWMSALSGVGNRRDKSSYFFHQYEPLGYSDCRDLWRGNWLAARLIELIPSHMLREGFTINSTDDKDASEAVQTHLKKLNFSTALTKALQLQRGFGGSAILLGVQDGSTNLADPLQIDRVRSFDWCTVFEARELVPCRFYNDPAAPKYGAVSHYRIMPLHNMESGDQQINQKEIHESRLLVFQGVQIGNLPQTGTSGSHGWGDSILNRVWKEIRDFGISWATVSTLLVDFSQAVFSIAGLSEIVAKDDGKLLQGRLAAVDLGRSVTRATLLDKDLESFERKATPVTGLPELLDRIMVLISAAAGIPVTVLMQQSPSGLNATGESDIRLHYDNVAKDREIQLTPNLEYVVGILAKMYNLQDGWCIEYPPLWQPSEGEQATARKTQADSDAVYITNGVVSPEEIAYSRFAGGKYSYETVVDFAGRAALEATAAPPVESQNKQEPAQAPTAQPVEQIEPEVV
jgi:uncharacterized protein